MRNTLIVVILLLFSSQLNAQTMSVVAKVERDQVLLKWFPKDFQQLKLLIDKGATIDRIELSGDKDPSTLDYSGAKRSRIEPASVRFNALDKNAPETAKIQSLLEPFLTEEKADNKEGENFSFALATLENSVSSSFGLLIGSEWKDTEIEKGKTYAYRIRIDGGSATYTKVKIGQLTKYPAIDNFSVALDQKTAVELKWQAKKYQESGFGFLLEKSIDAPKEGTYLTQTPYVPVRTQDEKADKEDFYRDKDLIEGKTHFYRLIGLNYFGEKVMFSEWQKVYVPNHIHADVYIDSIYAKGQTRIIVGGASSTDSKPKNIVGYTLLKSKQKDSGYEVFESKKTTDSLVQFTVPMSLTGDQFYYKLVGYSIDKDSVYSLPNYFFTLDQEAPKNPTALTGTIDSLGIVHIKWIAPTDKDLQGYRIFRANDKREDFTERNKTLSLETAFTDTVLLDNLTSEIYYCVSAVDKNYNNSGYSDTLLIIKPDTIAPASSEITSLVSLDSLIRITWENSPSTDIKTNVLVRIAENKLDTLTQWTNELKEFTDTNLNAGITYQYRIITSDKSANTSYSEPKQLYYETGYRKALTGARAIANRETKSIDLTWEAPKEKVFSFQVFRATENGKLVLIKTIEDEKCSSFTDKNISIGNKYDYTIKYISQSGIHSLPTNKLEVLY